MARQGLTDAQIQDMLWDVDIDERDFRGDDIGDINVTEGEAEINEIINQLNVSDPTNHAANESIIVVGTVGIDDNQHGIEVESHELDDGPNGIVVDPHELDDGPNGIVVNPHELDDDTIDNGLDLLGRSSFFLNRSDHIVEKSLDPSLYNPQNMPSNPVTLTGIYQRKAPGIREQTIKYSNQKPDRQPGRQAACNLPRSAGGTLRIPANSCNTELSSFNAVFIQEVKEDFLKFTNQRIRKLREMLPESALAKNTYCREIGMNEFNAYLGEKF